jgi:hypothetical protein
VDCTKAEPSPLSSHAWLAQIVWYSSVIPLGGAIRLLAFMAKNPTTTSPRTVVVIDGAVGNLVAGENAPLCESIGVVRSTFLKSRIAPVAEDAEASVQP